jgi:Fe-S cluster biogenesis protein NfuA
MNPLPMSSPEPARPAEPANLADFFAPPAPKADAAAAPGATGTEDPGVRARVETILDELRPFINADGGDIRLVSVIDGVVKVRLHGACVGCSSSMYTLQLGIERKLKEEVPGIKMVEAVP